MKKLVTLVLALSLILVLFAGCGNSSAGAGGSTPTPGDVTATVDPIVTETANVVDSEPGETYSVGFVTFGLGGDFFQQLADAYVEKMTALGWEASYADGQFNPTTQIEACENYIAMGVDVLVLWSVAPEAMGTVVSQAVDKGIKVIAFVAETEKYDVLMISKEDELAGYCAKLAAQWIDEKFADAEDHSVPVAVLTCRTAETGVVQGDVLLQIEQFSKKAKFVIEVECADENASTGQEKAENLYTTNPEIKVFLSAHNGLALGVSNFFTSIDSPVTDYSDMGIFTINGDMSIAERIKSAENNESPIRGMVLTGGVEDTAKELSDMAVGIMDGSIKSGHIQMAGTIFVNANTVDEYLTTGKVISVTNKDYD